jgi:hypothetical protein
MTVNRLTRWILVAALVALARPAAAQHLIVETATYQASAPGSEFNVGVGDYYGWYDEWIMVKFHLSTRTSVTRVGIANVHSYDGSPVTLFAAIVPINASGVPDGPAPFDDAKVIAHTVFQIDGSDQKVPLSATLDPGDYAVVFGGDRYGAGGYAVVHDSGQTPLGDPAIRITDNYYFYDGNGLYWPTADDWTAWYHYSPLSIRITVEASATLDGLSAAIDTRASQASVDALAASLTTLATKQNVTDLGSSIGGSFVTLTGLLNARTADVRGDIAAVRGRVDGLMNSVAALNLTGVATQADVQTGATNVSNVVATRASQSSVDDLALRLGGNGDLALTVVIEHALADGTRLAILFLPEASGGHLERVRDLVDQLRAANIQTGNPLARAQNQFDKGESAFAARDYKGAFDAYANAYQLLVK